jgi:phosphoserine phosphatase
VNDGTQLPSWRDGAARTAIIDFLTQVEAANVPIEARIAVFDNDGTLMCEKPLPVEADFLLRRLAEQAKDDPTLRDRQPWKAALEKDATWFGDVINQHYAGDDTNVRTLLGGIVGTYAGLTVEAFEEKAAAFLRGTHHPTLGFAYLLTTYQPMVELLGYLAANGFSNHIVSGSGADFLRPVSQELYGIPPERVIGSAGVLQYTSDGNGGSITRKAALEFLDDGPQKPIQIWSRTGRRPLVAVGNSNGDLPMLEFAQQGGRPSLRILVNHDDADREFAYAGGAEKALLEARARGWVVASMKLDFATVFATVAAPVGAPDDPATA